jgi:hypothetical protein
MINVNSNFVSVVSLTLLHNSRLIFSNLATGLNRLEIIRERYLPGPNRNAGLRR